MSTVSYRGARRAVRSLRLAVAGLLGLAVIAVPGAVSPRPAAAVPAARAVPVNQAATSAAAVAPRVDGSQFVVYRGEDDAAYYRTFSNGVWSAEGGLSGVLVGPPAVTVTGTSTYVVAARGWDGALWLKTSSGGVWGGWQSLGGVLSAGPAIVGGADGRLDVFVRGNTNVLYTRTRLPGAAWGPWRSLGGVLTSGPAAVALGPGRIDVYVIGWDYAVWRISLSNGLWSSWASLGGRSYSAPAAVRVRGTVGAMVFVRGVDNALWVNQNPTGAWTGWRSLSGLLIDAPGAATAPAGDVEVIVRGRDNALWSRRLQAGTWAPWVRGWIPAAPTPPAAGLRGVDWTRIPTTSNVIALTFDAGGNARGLPSIRSTLQTKNVPATFYLTGNWVRVFPAEANLIANSGFLVGNHSDTHPHFPALTDAQVRAEVLNAQQAVLYANGADTRPLFRFPYGDVNSRVLADVNALNYVAVRWTVDSLGWQGTSGGQTTAKVVSRVLAGARPGAIVLMHIGSNPTDGTTLDASALPQIIDSLRARGYRFVTLDALTG